MSRDLRPILAGWDHEPGELQVRIIAGDDGNDQLQLRLDLGVLQMELHGRPDGRRPHGLESLLDHHESQSRAFDAAEDAYTLDPSDCEELMREGVQYYHRYVALFHLGRNDLVVRDTDRNLRLFAFVRSHTSRRRDTLAFDQYRPYVTMMRTRAMVQQAIDRGEHIAAIASIDEGIAGIESFFREYEQEEHLADSQELTFLRDLRRTIESEREVTPEDRVEEQLRNAVAREDYEEAARLRDQLGRLRAAGSPRPFPDPASR